METTVPAAPVDARPTRGLHARLHLLILVTLLPLLVTGAIAIWLAARDYRQNSEQRLQETATALARGVDQGILDNISQLRLLAMLAPQVEESEPQLRAWARQNPDVALIAGDSAQAHTLPPALLARARASGQAQVSNLYTAAASTTPRVAIVLPYTDPTGQARVLAMVQPSNRLISTIMRSASEQSLLVSVVDGNGVIAARSRKPEQFIGQSVPNRDHLQQGHHSGGVFEAINKEGQPVVFAFHRLHAAPGWALVVGEPQTSFQARWQRPLAGMIIGGTLAAIIALLAANAIAGSILRPIRALAQRGHSIINDELTRPDPPASTITEVRILQDSFNDTIDALKKSADEAHALARDLMTSEQRYRAVAEAGALVLWESGQNWQVRSVTGWRELTGQPDEDALGRGWLQRVNEEDLPQIDAALEQSFSKGAPLDVEFRILDLYGRWRWLRARGARIGTEQHAGWAGVLEDVDARRQAQARIAFLAQHDPLTALPNRVVLFDQLQHALATAMRGHSSALLLLDLDRFKEVNDTLGHPSGDRLLQDVARRVLGCVRTNDLVARLGGDEFAILMAPEGRPPEAAMALAERLISSLSRPFDLEGHQLGIGTSIGIVLIDKHAETADKLMRNADLALYRAKEDGKGCYRFFEEEMDTRMQRRRQLETDLREALQQQQFQLHYQPLVDLVHSRVTGFEALLRWNHPERGLLDPGQFLSLAEDIGLMVPLGDWVLRQAMRDAIQWPEQLKVAVNLSVSQLALPELAGTIEQALAETGLTPSRLELEITENALVANIQAASAKLLRLKAAGISIVMDDFGTGYSSLGYLRAFPFDKVKIDKSFIRDLGQQSQGSAIIGAVSHLCEKLGIVATIEGVETLDQLAQLRQEHCTEGQGYVFGRPMPQQQISEFLRLWPSRWPSQPTP